MATAPLFGDPAANAPVWGKYAVLLAPLGATVPAGNAAFSLNDGTTVTTQWDPIGALADDAFDDGSEAIESTDHTAAGFGVYATTYKNQKETRTFTAKESTLVTLGLVYDTSGITVSSGNLTGTLKLRDPSEKFLIAFHRQNKAGTLVERYISKNHATIDSITRTFGGDESTKSVTVAIVPTASDELYTYYKGAGA